jgi:putative membrane protein (TIGR04086 family)
MFEIRCLKKGLERMKMVRKSTARQEKTSLLNDILSILKGSVFAVVITLIFIILFAAVMQLSTLPESIIRPVVQVLRILSIAAGGAFVARKAESRGWIKGAATGVFYVLLVSLIGVVSGGQFSFDRIFISDLLMGIVVGAIGGAIGINT